MRESALARVVACAEHECPPDFRFGSDIRSCRTRGRAREIADHDVAVERSSTRDRMPCEAEGAAATIEHEIVVSAVLIDVHDWHAVLRSHAAEHLFALRVLPD